MRGSVATATLVRYEETLLTKAQALIATGNFSIAVVVVSAHIASLRSEEHWIPRRLGRCRWSSIADRLLAVACAMLETRTIFDPDLPAPVWHPAAKRYEFVWGRVLPNLRRLC
jgi:hypothetical protein